jgi:ABC-type polysaccharide/polyol phosphate transport system ATPase subunit
VRLESITVSYNLSRKSRNLFFPSFREKRKPNVVNRKSALDNFSLTIAKGSRLGLVGKNGSGKTTLLKVLAGILRPTSGSVKIEGSIGALFTGLPFVNPNLSPRENIIQYCELNQSSKTQKENLIEDIFTFTELGQYFDQPLIFGSAGMITRFNFGMMTSETKDILIIDEGIGAGDQFFKEKAEKRLGEFYNRASILVMASHSNDFIEGFCDNAIELEGGKLVFAGKATETIANYNSKLIGRDT